MLFVAKADPLLVLRDLLGHSSVLTTEKYLRKLETACSSREAWERSGLGGDTAADAGAEREAAAEFSGDPDRERSLMPATVETDPPGIWCMFSDGSIRFSLDGWPAPGWPRTC